MSLQHYLVSFAHEDDLLGATREARKQGLRIVDAYTPYAVHGFDSAMGLKPSRLTWVCFVCGMCGFLGMLWFEHWTASISWPVDIGGKPWNSLPSDIPVAFEAAVLLGGFGSVFALFVAARLFPGKASRNIHCRTTDDRFVLVCEETDPGADLQSICGVFREFDPIEIQELPLDDSTGGRR